MTNKSMIEVRGLHKSYGTLQVLKGIDLEIARGEVVAVIGRSGSGKTTMLRCLNGLEEAQVGTIRLGEHTINCTVPLSRQQGELRALRLRAGFVFQNFNLFPHRTALENVIEGLVIVKGMAKKEAEARGMALLERVGLAARAAAYPSQMSGGQQQRAAIARALAMEPEVILFDEPTSALDPELVGEVLDVIRSLAQEHRTMVIVTHEMNFARDVADRTIFMDQGVVVEQAPSKELFAQPREEATRHFLRRLG
ncbi:L-cystine import ATP-binding protein TcyC [Brucella sp. NBRC 14130]|jgi:cystine transport system ATP-binding protein|uniref:Amino acid ABC transporter ATP-binding protein n=2 Tax=Pseudomonadota TaxID=1224 RepID=A0ABT8ZSL4_9SPHN|nr:amino acid ABC transporter ATP-binding protein [Sphingobium sp. HBC34]MDO7837529.1 amino acid ABC transporter ATP-binding protein [Sphingobium sp. HBC34]